MTASTSRILSLLLRSYIPAVYCSPLKVPLYFSIFTQSLSEQISIITVCCPLPGSVECACTYCVALMCSFRLYFHCMHTVTTFHHACPCQSTNLFPLSNEGYVHANLKNFYLFKYLCMRRNCHSLLKGKSFSLTPYPLEN